MSLMGLDLGTTGVKAIVFTPEGKILGQAYREYQEIYPEHGWVEMNPLQIWKYTKQVIQEATFKAKRDPPQAFSLCVLGEAVTPVDKKGNPLCNSITAVDRRSFQETEWLQESLGKKYLFQITGMPLHLSYTLTKILWIKNKRPDIFDKTWKFLLYEDFILYKLGFDPVLDYSLAARTMAFDIHTRDWSDEILSKIGLDKSLFSTVTPSGKIVGRINSKIAEQLGLPSDTVVVTGGHDQPVSALGAGVIREGEATDTCGTVECVTCVSDRLDLPLSKLTYNYATYPHVIEEKFVTIAYFYTAGALLKWYRDNFAFKEKQIARREKRDIYEVIIEKIKEEPSSVLLLPHFVGSGTPWLDPSSKGALVGLTLETKPEDIIKAILDSVGYELRINLELLEKSGVKVDILHSIGGGAKSNQWLQIKADITGKIFQSLQITEAGCLGAAILAGKATGIYKDFEEAVQKMIRYKARFSPRKEQREKYQRKYRIYRKLYSSLRKINSRL